MKFSFEAENYRKKLTEEILEKRKSGDNMGAYGILKEKENSPEYQIAKAITIIKKNENEEKTKEQIQQEREEIFAYMEQQGFDVIDLSKSIPDEINILIDKTRLSSLGETSKRYLPLEGRAEMVAEYLDSITNGEYSDKRNPNHVIDAYWERGVGGVAEDTLQGHSYSYLSMPLNFGLNGKCWVVFGNSPFIDREPSKPIVIFTLENPIFKKLMQDQYDPELDQWIQKKKVEINGEENYQISQDEAKMVPNIILDQLPVNMHQKIEGTYLKFNNPKLLMVLKEYGYTQEDKSVFTWPLIASYIIDLKDKTMFKFNPEKNIKK